MNEARMEETYSLKELCQAAQVTERTVRYYIQEGLLPPPDSAGPYARYSRQHLARLRLIRHLKSDYLPLAEIRRRLHELTPETIETLAQQAILDGELDEAEGDARSYIDGLLSKPETDSAYRSTPLLSRKRQAPPPQQAPAYAIAPSPQQAPVDAMPPPQAPGGPPSEFIAESEIWQRLTLAPGIELHYQVDNDPDQRSRIARLLEQAKRIFST